MKPLLEKSAVDLWITDAGLETYLIYLKDEELPEFASFPLIDSPKGKKKIDEYYKGFLDLAVQMNTGCILESPTWRANPDWGLRLEFSQSDLNRLNKLAIQQMKSLIEDHDLPAERTIISGCIGPRYDGYVFEEAMTSLEASNYHADQINAFKEGGAQLITALTMTNSMEALGIVNQALKKGIQIVISFTVETDGKLPSGESLKEAIMNIDRATDNYPAYYMINCAHPSHFINELDINEAFTQRIAGIRSNASCKSHEELDAMTELDRGDILALSNWHTRLLEKLPHVKVVGGCCGTDHEHVHHLAKTHLKVSA